MDTSFSSSPSGSYTKVNPPFNFFLRLLLVAVSVPEAADAAPLPMVGLTAGGVTKLVVVPFLRAVPPAMAKLEAAGGASGTILAWGIKSRVVLAGGGTGSGGNPVGSCPGGGKPGGIMWGGSGGAPGYGGIIPGGIAPGGGGGGGGGGNGSIGSSVMQSSSTGKLLYPCAATKAKAARQAASMAASRVFPRPHPRS